MMASKKIKKYTDGIDIDDTLSTDGAQSELSLADDSDLSVSYGTLSISTSTSAELTDEEKSLRRDSDVPVGSRAKSLSICSTNSDIQIEDKNPSRVHFEIAKAGTVTEGRSKYVSYTILIIRSHELDKAQAIIDRRYSDFEKLNVALKKSFPLLMENIAFPPKIISGNFKQETIARRSRAFEQYLTHIHSLPEIRRCKDFANFFYNIDLQEAYAHIRNARYKDAVPLLHNSVNVQDKLLGENHKEVIATLCGLVACYNALEQFKEAQGCADTALRCIGKSEKNRYLVPLLQISIRLCWTLGKDKTDLEARLADLRNRNFPVDLAQTLLELAVKRFYASS